MARSVPITEFHELPAGGGAAEVAAGENQVGVGEDATLLATAGSFATGGGAPGHPSSLAGWLWHAVSEIELEYVGYAALALLALRILLSFRRRMKTD